MFGAVVCSGWDLRGGGGGVWCDAVQFVWGESVHVHSDRTQGLPRGTKTADSIQPAHQDTKYCVIIKNNWYFKKYEIIKRLTSSVGALKLSDKFEKLTEFVFYYFVFWIELENLLFRKWIFQRPKVKNEMKNLYRISFLAAKPSRLFLAERTCSATDVTWGYSFWILFYDHLHIKYAFMQLRSHCDVISKWFASHKPK